MVSEWLLYEDWAYYLGPANPLHLCIFKEDMQKIVDANEKLVKELKTDAIHG